MSAPLYRDPAQPPDRRADDLLARMTLTEKIGQLVQELFGWTVYRKTNDAFTLTDSFRDLVQKFGGIGGVYGVLRADPWSQVHLHNGVPGNRARHVTALVQQYLVEHTRLGVPTLISNECPHGHMAIDGQLLPINIGVGATWNPDLYETAMRRVGMQLTAMGVDLGLATVMDVVRDPRWGRTEECFGEDPLLVSRFGSSLVRGVQHNGTTGVVAKHFTAHGDPRGGRNQSPAAIGRRELHDIHLPPAEAAVRAGAVAIMAAYNEVDGLPCHADPWLLTELLRDRWHFEGVVMSDAVAIGRLTGQLAPDDAAAAALSLRCGMDMNLGDDTFPTLQNAVDRGLVDETTIDRAVRRVLLLKFKLGLFERPYAQLTQDDPVDITDPLLDELSLQLARESLVLLKNAGPTLPWSTPPRSLAVIGPNADRLDYLLGDYTQPLRPGVGATILEGIRELAGQTCAVQHTRGCGIRDESRAGFDEAIALAKSSDAVVLVLGGSSTRSWDSAMLATGAASDLATEMDCGEGMDVADLELGGVQVELAKALVATGKPVVVVLVQGRPHAIPWLAEHCDAVLCAWYPGPFGGRAIAEAIFGRYNPGGKLPVSVPRCSAQLPVFYNHKHIVRQHDYRDGPAEPLFPFGFGLSYTRFEHQCALKHPRSLTVAQLHDGAAFEVAASVKNVGKTAGDAVIQAYTRRTIASVTPRVRELKAFRRIHLSPGEQHTVTLRLGRAELELWDAAMRRVVEPGEVRVFVGGNPNAMTELTCVIGE